MNERIPTAGLIIINQNKVLLVEHGDGAGHLTGSLGTPGGRVDKDESTIQTAVRETKEETGLDVKEEDLVEIPHIYEADLPRKNGDVLYVTHTVFATNKFGGELVSTDETKPQWIEIDRLGDYELMVNTKDMIDRALKSLKNEA